MTARTLSNVIGFDDSPFPYEHRGDVRIVGAVCARTRLDGVVSGWVRRDGANSTDRMVELVNSTRFGEHIQAILMQGIAVAGFNVVDLARLHHETDTPVLVVTRRRPRMELVRAALAKTPGGADKWALIEQAGALERLGALWVQKVGLTTPEAAVLLRATTSHGNIPEPLRLAHIIAGGVERGASRGRA